MQKIFYNAKFYTLNDGEEVAEAMLVNDGIIVFAGKKNEVFDSNKEFLILDFKREPKKKKKKTKKKKTKKKKKKKKKKKL